MKIKQHQNQNSNPVDFMMFKPSFQDRINYQKLSQKKTNFDNKRKPLQDTTNTHKNFKNMAFLSFLDNSEQKGKIGMPSTIKKDNSINHSEKGRDSNFSRTLVSSRHSISPYKRHQKILERQCSWDLRKSSKSAQIIKQNLFQQEPSRKLSFNNKINENIYEDILNKGNSEDKVMIENKILKNTIKDLNHKYSNLEDKYSDCKDQQIEERERYREELEKFQLIIKDIKQIQNDYALEKSKNEQINMLLTQKDQIIKNMEDKFQLSQNCFKQISEMLQLQMKRDQLINQCEKNSVTFDRVFKEKMSQFVDTFQQTGYDQKIFSQFDDDTSFNRNQFESFKQIINQNENNLSGFVNQSLQKLKNSSSKLSNQAMENQSFEINIDNKQLDNKKFYQSNDDNQLHLFKLYAVNDKKIQNSQDNMDIDLLESELNDTFQMLEKKINESYTKKSQSKLKNFEKNNSFSFTQSPQKGSPMKKYSPVKKCNQNPLNFGMSPSSMNQLSDIQTPEMNYLQLQKQSPDNLPQEFEIEKHNEIDLSMSNFSNNEHIQQNNSLSFQQSEISKCTSNLNTKFNQQFEKINIEEKKQQNDSYAQINQKKKETNDPKKNSKHQKISDQQIKTQNQEYNSVQQMVQAKFDFNGVKDKDLSFKKGDIFQILQKIENGWWIGLHNNTIGFFPYNYVTIIPN